MKNLVIFGASNILSDIFDCAIANHVHIKSVVLHHAETVGERDRSVQERIADLQAFDQAPQLLSFEEFRPQADDLYILGPTTPQRSVLASALVQRFGLNFTTLIHPTAYVSPLARVGQGVFIGANSVIGPGVHLAQHVFVNRGVTVGHDTRVGAFSRLQPGCNVGGLTVIGDGVTVGIGATLIERLVIGDHAFLGAGAVVTADVAHSSLVVGVPAKFKKLVNQDL